MGDLINSENEKEDLTLENFTLPSGDIQVILMDKQIGRNHFVFTHGTKKNDKIRCFLLSQLEMKGNFYASEYISANAIANVARLLGFADENGFDDNIDLFGRLKQVKSENLRRF